MASTLAKKFPTSHSALPDIQDFRIERMLFTVTYITSNNREVGEVGEVGDAVLERIVCEERCFLDRSSTVEAAQGKRSW